MEETGVPGENHLSSASLWQTLSHNVVSSTHRHVKHQCQPSMQINNVHLYNPTILLCMFPIVSSFLFFTFSLFFYCRKCTRFPQWNKRLCKSKYDTNASCQQGESWKGYIKSKCRHNVLLDTVICWTLCILDICLVLTISGIKHTFQICEILEFGNF